MSLNDIHEDLWLVILRYFSLDDLLVGEKVFGISSSVFSTLIGCEVAQFDNSCRDGGIFYRLLMEKLVTKQLELAISRIVDRNVMLCVCGDYDEESNSHHAENSGPPPVTGRGRGRVRIQYFTRSRLNVEPCGRSMSKLRGNLMNLIGLCHDQFPHIYEEYKSRFNAALKRSIKICTQVDKPLENEYGFLYENNCLLKPKKPSIWNEEKRVESIMMKFKKAKPLKRTQWRVKWAYEYRNYLLYELEYLLDNLKNNYRLVKRLYGRHIVNSDLYFDIVDSIHEIVSKFDQDFQKHFYTERKFYVKKKKLRYGNVSDISTELQNINFINNIVLSVSKIRNHPNVMVRDTMDNQRFMKTIEKHLSLHIKYYGNSFREHIPNTTIYHYLVRNGADMHKYFTPEVKEQIKNSPEKTQHSFMFALIKGSKNHFPIELVELLLNCPLKIEKQIYGREQNFSLADAIILSAHFESSDVEQWIEFFIEKYGRHEFIEAISTSIAKDVVDYYNYTHSKLICDLLGDEFNQKLSKVI